MKKKIKKVFLSAALVIPLNTSEGWKPLKYSKIPAHKVEFSDRGLHVSVDKSAGPLVYPFKKQVLVKKVQVKGVVKKKIVFKGKQVDVKNDDFALRLGFVVKGENTLSFGKRLVAPKWVRSLFAVAPKGTGVDFIQFYNAVQQPELIGKERTHPLSKLLKESHVWLLKFDSDGEAKIDFSTDIESPKSILGLWIAIDGDDTLSRFEVSISELILN